MSTERVDPVGAQPTDPPWARLLFRLVEGREGQWWRGSLLMALAGLFVVAFFGALAALLALAGWIGGALSIGSLATGGAIALSRRHRRVPR